MELGDSLVPTLDYSSGSERELERLSAIERAIELETAAQEAGVVDYDCFTGLLVGGRWHVG